MAAVGVVFTYLLQESVNRVVADVSPVAFAVLAVVGAVLLVDPSGFSRVPTLEPPQSRYPALSAFSYGFFGRSSSPVIRRLSRCFRADAGAVRHPRGEYARFSRVRPGHRRATACVRAPSEPFGRQVTRTLARYSSQINRATGAILLVVAAYYLLFVFDVVPWMG